MPRIRLTPEERREKNRLRSQAWRRAHGIMPRKPARRPWEAEGISRSTWYRRKAKTREQAALAARVAGFERMSLQLETLRESLDRLTAFNTVFAQVLREPLPLIW
jgi:hypothetical protein